MLLDDEEPQAEKKDMFQGQDTMWVTLETSKGVLVEEVQVSFLNVSSS